MDTHPPPTLPASRYTVCAGCEEDEEAHDDEEGWVVPSPVVLSLFMVCGVPVPVSMQVTGQTAMRQASPPVTDSA